MYVIEVAHRNKNLIWGCSIWGRFAVDVMAIGWRARDRGCRALEALLNAPGLGEESVEIC
jgi:hypothetical protein